MVCVLSAACAGTAHTTYVAPSNETVVGDMEMAEVPNAQNIYIENRSTVAIMVTGVRLTDCENIKERCEVTHMRERVNPGDRARVMVVHAENSTRSTSLRYGFTWELADRTGRDPSVAALDSAGGRTSPEAWPRPLPPPTPVSRSAPAPRTMPASRPAPVARPTPVRSRRLTVGVDSLMMTVGERISFHGMAAQRLSGDSTGGLQLAVADSTIAKVTGPDELHGLRPGRTELMMRVGPTLTRMLVVVRGGGNALVARDASPVVGMVVRPTRLTLRVGQRLGLDGALKVLQRRASGAMDPVTGWSLLVEDQSIATLGSGVLIGRKAGETAILVEIGGNAARVPVIVKR